MIIVIPQSLPKVLKNLIEGQKLTHQSHEERVMNNNPFAVKQDVTTMGVECILPAYGHLNKKKQIPFTYALK